MLWVGAACALLFTSSMLGASGGWWAACLALYASGIAFGLARMIGQALGWDHGSGATRWSHAGEMEIPHYTHPL